MPIITQKSIRSNLVKVRIAAEESRTLGQLSLASLRGRLIDYALKLSSFQQVLTSCAKITLVSGNVRLG